MPLVSMSTVYKRAARLLAYCAAVALSDLCYGDCWLPGHAERWPLCSLNDSFVPDRQRVGRQVAQHALLSRSRKYSSTCGQRHNSNQLSGVCSASARANAAGVGISRCKAQRGLPHSLKHAISPPCRGPRVRCDRRRHCPALPTGACAQHCRVGTRVSKLRRFAPKSSRSVRTSRSVAEGSKVPAQVQYV